MSFRERNSNVCCPNNRRWIPWYTCAVTTLAEGYSEEMWRKKFVKIYVCFNTKDFPQLQVYIRDYPENSYKLNSCNELLVNPTICYNFYPSILLPLAVIKGFLAKRMYMYHIAFWVMYNHFTWNPSIITIEFQPLIDHVWSSQLKTSSIFFWSKQHNSLIIH